MALAGFLSTAASCLYVNKVARLTILPQKKKKKDQSATGICDVALGVTDPSTEAEKSLEKA
jgi:hypothetical protein